MVSNLVSFLDSSVSAILALTGALVLFFALSGQFLDKWPCLLQVIQRPSFQSFLMSLSESVVSVCLLVHWFLLLLDLDLSACVSMALGSGSGILHWK